MDPNQSSPTTPITPVSPLTELPHGPEKLLPAPHKSSWGAWFGILIILIVLTIGALYFWGEKLTEEDAAAGITTEVQL
ncbi:MAG: hypothetical protein Q7R64_02545 [bacterium]|nr:hypothetical protein [bacterium]